MQRQRTAFGLARRRRVAAAGRALSACCSPRPLSATCCACAAAPAASATAQARRLRRAAPAERTLLCALLERFSVTYAYVNLQDVEVPSPYAATAKRVLEGDESPPQVFED